MAHVIEVEGRTAVVFCLKDMMELIDQHMGPDFLTREHRTELDEIREHYHNVIRDIRDQSEEMAGLIREKRLNRNAISKCAGKIGTLTWREL